MRLIEQNVILAGLYGTNQVGYIYIFLNNNNKKN